MSTIPAPDINSGRRDTRMQPDLELEAAELHLAEGNLHAALSAASRAAIGRRRWSAPFRVIAKACEGLGDKLAAKAYSQLSGDLDNPAPTTSEGDFHVPELLADEDYFTNLCQVAARELAADGSTSRVKLIVGGDVCLGRQMPGYVGLHGPAWPFQGLAPRLCNADLAMVNLETSVTTTGDFLDKGGRRPYYYHSRPEMLDVLIEAGIHAVCSANNHAMDYGTEGLRQQTGVLEACGFVHFGAGTDEQSAAMPAYVNIDGLTLAFIGVETETPCMSAAASTPGILHSTGRDILPVVAASIAQAKACADVIVVSPHWGNNWQEAPREAFRRLAKAFIDLGADAVLGHSAHILQGIESHAGKPIVYDMGTLLFDRVEQGRMRYSALFELTLTSAGVESLEIIPVRLEPGRATLADGVDAGYIRKLVMDLSRELSPELSFTLRDQSLVLSCLPVNKPNYRRQRPPVERVRIAGNSPKIPAELRELRSNVVYSEVPVAAAWRAPVRVNRDLEVLGATFATPVRPRFGFFCEVFFRSVRPPAGRWEARLSGIAEEGETRFTYTHPVAEGIWPAEYWRPDDVIGDRVVVRPPNQLPEGIYQLYWQLVDLESGVSMSVEGGPDPRIANGMVHIGTLTISQDAPGGVAGIPRPSGNVRLATAAQAGEWGESPLGFWESEAQAWVVEALARQGITWRPETVTLVRNNPWGLVLSMETDHGRIFFKALGPANRCEPRLLEALAARWGERIPRPMAIHHDRPWMITFDCGPSLLEIHGRNVSRELWTDMVRRLAEIQIESCRDVPRWLALGVPDRRVEKLPDLLAGLLDNEQAIGLGLPTGLGCDERAEARNLLPYFRECCVILAASPFSAGLSQGDFHMGNILAKESQLVLGDWGAACLTHPFCSLLLAYHPAGLRNDKALAQCEWLDEAYLGAWLAATGETVDKLRVVLHGALWVAHVIRALSWANSPVQTETMPSGEKRTMVAKWINLWVQRKTLLTGKLLAKEPKQMGRFPRPPVLATVDNPLLLDAGAIAHITGGKWHCLPDNAVLTGMSHKRSYLVNGTQGNLYFPVNLNEHDHSFTPAHVTGVIRAIEAGAAAAVVPVSAKGLPEGLPLLRVENVRVALERLGTQVRDELFAGKRVLVTGTEGKTGFKCMLHHVLSPQISTHAVLNSSNLGFSLDASFASIRRRDRVAIFEAAGTHPGRCKRRSNQVRPHLVVITEVGNEHINFHGSQQAVIESKADIVSGLVEGGYGILNADSLNYAALRKAVLARRRVPLLTFGTGPGCNGRLIDRRFEGNGWVVSAEIEGEPVEYRLPLLGEHAPLASVSVVLAAYYLGADVARAAAEFADFVPYESQGVLRHIPHQGGEFLLFDNASRASVLSYQSALRTAARLTPPVSGGRKVAMIGQMIFLGDEAPREHARLAEWIDEAGFERIILVGQHMEVTLAHLKNRSAVVKSFPSYDRRHSGKRALQALIDTLMAEVRCGDIVFVKGELDEVGDYLRSLEIKQPLPGCPAVVPRASLSQQRVEKGGDANALTGLEKLSINDLGRYKAAINQTRQTCWQSYFPFLYLHGQKSNAEFFIEEDSGSICIYRLRRQGDSTDLSLFLLPMPFQAAVLERCLERVRDFNGTPRASIFRVDAEDIHLFRERSNTRIVACPEEYIYAPARYRDLSGNKNRNLRRSIQEIERRDDVEVLDYREEFREDCIAVLKQWTASQESKYKGVLYHGYTHNCLEQYQLFPRKDLFGKVIRVGGEVRSFGFAGEMRAGMGNLFITYSDFGIDGLNKYLNYCLLREMENQELVNSSNAGDTPGLVFAKQALGPVALHPLFQVYAGC